MNLVRPRNSKTRVGQPVENPLKLRPAQNAIPFPCLLAWLSDGLDHTCIGGHAQRVSRLMQCFFSFQSRSGMLVMPAQALLHQQRNPAMLGMIVAASTPSTGAGRERRFAYGKLLVLQEISIGSDETFS